MKKSKILCTMGPSCDDVAVLKEMIQAGMNIARLNMAHGELEEHSERIRNLRQAATELHTIVPVLIDIKGPEVRIGELKDSSYELVQGGTVVLTTETVPGDSDRIPVNYKEMPAVVHPSSRILIDDGLIELSVIAVQDTEIICKVMNGGILKPRKGVNLPGVRTTLPGVTERDVNHILFGLQHQIDIIAVSFVRRGDDIREIRQLLEEHDAGHIQIISKIENAEGVAGLDDIIEASDGIMVARGDLGVEIPVEDVPLIQKQIIEKCNLAGKPVIVATHMLESMQINPRPTRAEVSDVANAVLQGADVLMLSGETAAGKYPVESVATMAAIAGRTESMFDYRDRFSRRNARNSATVTEMISRAAAGSALDLDAAAIITPTESGFTARMVSKQRPKAPIIAITPNEFVLSRLCLLWGVFPVKGETAGTTDDMFESAITLARQTGIVAEKDYVVISAGVPLGQTGTTNLIKIDQV